MFEIPTIAKGIFLRFADSEIEKMKTIIKQHETKEYWKFLYIVSDIKKKQLQHGVGIWETTWYSKIDKYKT